MSTHPLSKGGLLSSVETLISSSQHTHRIPCLQKHSPRARELTNQPLTRREIRHDPTRSYSLEDVLRIPSHQVTVIDDVSFSIRKLYCVNIYPSNDNEVDPSRERVKSVVREARELTSFLIIAPKLVIQSNPTPLIL